MRRQRAIRYGRIEEGNTIYRHMYTLRSTACCSNTMSKVLSPSCTPRSVSQQQASTKQSVCFITMGPQTLAIITGAVSWSHPVNLSSPPCTVSFCLACLRCLPAELGGETKASTPPRSSLLRPTRCKDAPEQILERDVWVRKEGEA